MSSVFTLGGRTYQVVVFHKPSEHSLTVQEMVRRGVELGIPLTSDDYLWLTDHLSEIPINLVVTPVAVVEGISDVVLVLYRDANVWKAKWVGGNRKFYGHCRLLRRLPDKSTK